MRRKHAQAWTFTVEFPAPLDIPASLEIFRRTGDDGLDRWDGHALVRTTRIGDTVVPFIGTVVGTVDAPALQVTVPQATQAPAVEHTVRTMFVTAPGPLAELLVIDPVIAGLEARYPGLRPVLQLDPLTALIRVISAQQVNLRWATTTRRRLAEAFGCQHTLGAHQVFSLDASRLAAVDVMAIRALQLTTRKAEYIVALATAVATGRLDLAALHDQPDAAVIACLTACRGLGRWTAEWFLARVLGRPRVVAGDLGVRKAVGAAYGHGHLPSETAVRELTAHWGAAAGVAQQLLLHGLSQGF
jgi:DNA-3-methyladenine glycosylase II